jgi:hypothetical protein
MDSNGLLAGQTIGVCLFCLQVTYLYFIKLDCALIIKKTKDKLDLEKVKNGEAQPLIKK